MYKKRKKKHGTKDKDKSQACKNTARKAKAQNEQRLQKNARDNTTAFSSYAQN